MCSIWEWNFQRVSNAVETVLRHKSGHETINDLDDFLFLAISKIVCGGIVNQFLSICSEIRFPVALDKTCWASTVIVFLGMIMDSHNRIIAVPADKRDKALHLLHGLLASKKTTVLKLQHIAGIFGFLCKAVYPGRAHTRRFPSKTKGLKQCHHARVDQEMRQDSLMWVNFLTDNTNSVNRPFVDFSKTLYAEEIKFFSDASRAEIRAWAVFFLMEDGVLPLGNQVSSEPTSQAKHILSCMH